MTKYTENRKAFIAAFIAALFFAALYGIRMYSEQKYIEVCISGNATQLEQLMDRYWLSANTLLPMQKTDDNFYIWRYKEGDMESSTVDLTPVYLAAGNEDPGVLKLLFERGATFAPQGADALGRALLSWRVENVRLLLDVFKKQRGKPGAPADLSGIRRPPLAAFFAGNRIEEERKTILRELLAYGAFSYDPQGILLGAAEEIRDPEYYRILEQHGIDLQKNVSSLLERAATANNLPGTLFFLQRGGDPNAVVTGIEWVENGQGYVVTMPLISKAIARGAREKILAALLHAGADPNIRDFEGKTALTYLNEELQNERQSENCSKVMIDIYEAERALLLQYGAHE